MWNPIFFVEVLIGGLLSGIMYSLVALGFVLIFKASGVFNFAQGAMVLFAALTFVVLLEMGGTVFWDWTAWLSLSFAAIAGALYLSSRYPQLIKLRKKGLLPVFHNRIAIVAAAVAIVAVPLAAGDGGQLMWRGIFITLSIFLVITIGMRQPKAAAAVLLGLALASFFAGEINFWRSLVLTLVIMIVLAQAIEGIVLRPLVNQEPIILFMATIGLNYVMEGIAQGVWDADVHGLEIGIPDVVSEVGVGDFIIYVSQFDLFAAVIAGLLVTGLAIFFNRTRIGRALRAVADDHQAAMLVGISLETIWVVVWAAAGIVAMVAGLLWGSKVGVQFTLVLLAFKALPVLILGGFTSIPGAIVGGLIVGATEKLFEFFIGIPFLGGGTESWSPYMLAMVFLLFRPQGLFGERIIERV
ncbi:MAG: branched-chain amino acid ABC transporter permease [Arenicellales bacterium]|jgi:branched-chain amino acid transport system permease protein|nr:branched-chain amino acid ABC transporter permease [Arenicellales bacterium]MDP6854018.1 branched-chain amino acid ABC transporter permease [Arenicellales bacterium]MDP6948162.1 branched-chain amino acid ABC transporter permease [Arenicellales bacterium]